DRWHLRGVGLRQRPGGRPRLVHRGARDGGPAQRTVRRPAALAGGGPVRLVDQPAADSRLRWLGAGAGRRRDRRRADGRRRRGRLPRPCRSRRRLPGAAAAVRLGLERGPGRPGRQQLRPLSVARV
ncbi:MAG: hypothetical protein AVDCRST_MAG59-3056, partial [uncultured Thermomicrobiales bacterium]